MKKVFLIALFAIQSITFTAYADTVVAIHGFLSNARSMKPIKRALCRCGFDVYLWEYPSRQKFIQEHACHLVAELQNIACQCPGRPISFVTHSIGALVLRAALNMPGCPEEAKIGRAALLAPPNQGCCLARIFRDVVPISFAMGEKTGRQLTHYDASHIAYCFGEFPCTMCVLVVAGTNGNRIWFDKPNDGFIAVEETWLNTPFCFSSFPVTHGNLLKSSLALCNVKTFLLGLYTKPEPAVCGLGNLE